jgi:putative transposase
MLLGRSSWHYESRKDPQEALRRRLRELAMARPRYGYRRLHILLRREGWEVNAKRVWRLYCEEQLTVRVKRRKKRTAESRLPPREAERPNEQWSLDFMHDRLEDGRSFRILNVIDAMTRECLVCEAAASFRSTDVTRILDREIAKRGKPERLRLDNGTEFTSNHFDCWAYEKRIQLHFTQPGRPTQNGHIESFNGRVRDECLQANWFTSLADARDALEAWKREYNNERPHSALGGLAPLEYISKLVEGAA